MRTSALLLLFVLLAGCTGNPTSGRLTREEMRAGSEEIAQMMRGAKAGSPETANLSFEPKTQIGKDFKALIAESAKIELAFNSKLEKMSPEQALTPKQLSTDAGRQEARKNMAELRKETAAYFDKVGGQVNKLAGFVAKYAKKMNSSQQEALIRETSELRSIADTLYLAIDNFLEFNIRRKPAYNAAADTLEFRTDADVEEYNRLLEAVRSVGTKLETRSNEVMARRQQVMQAGLSQIGSAR